VRKAISTANQSACQILQTKNALIDRLKPLSNFVFWQTRYAGSLARKFIKASAIIRRQSGPASFQRNRRNASRTILLGRIRDATLSASSNCSMISVQNTAAATSSIVIDGAATRGTGTLSNTIGQVFLFSDNSSGFNQMNSGKGCGIGIWPGAWTSTQYANMNANMHDATNGWNF
jgi:hypothetical protein